MQNPITAAVATDAAAQTEHHIFEQVTYSETIVAADNQQRQTSTKFNELSFVVNYDVIDQAKKTALETLFADMIFSPRFWANPKRVARLEKALVLPLFDDRSMQQFYVSAKKELTKKALEAALAGNVLCKPTDAEICALASQKYNEKQTKLAGKKVK